MQKRKAQIRIDPARTIGDISPLLFGGFAEHLGRCIYQGIYEPGHPLADGDGLRSDVRDALLDLGFTVMRYPGGNFVSGYDWRDGIGPSAQRPRRRELAWKSVETNQFGTDEFLRFCRSIRTEPMLGLNFGTADIREAANLVEYCNAPVGTQFADLRAAHGRREPYGIQYWCLGNEMDGPWQIAHLDAAEYAKKAREAAKMMKWQDPSIRTILCGSSGPGMATYPEWDRSILELCWDQTDYLSLHRYVGNYDHDTDSYLGLTREFEDHVDTLAATLRYVKAKLRSKHDVFLSWDEWNVWYRAMEMDGRWQEAPPLLEEVYNFEDALVAALWMNVFLRKCDVLRIACLAQIVNVIAPILTRPGGLVRQTIFHVFRLFRRHAAGRALDLAIAAPRHATKRYGDLPLMDASASYDEAAGTTALFLVNRSRTDPVTVECAWQDRAPARIVDLQRLAGHEPGAVNTFDAPDVVTPRRSAGPAVRDGVACLTLPPLSFTVAVAR
jgi:alpha-N-arabinofuranosidase